MTQGSSNHNDTTNSSKSNVTTATSTNKKWILASHPKGHVNIDKDVKLITDTINHLQDCPPNKVIVQVHVLSIDAFIRTTLDKDEAYHGSVAVNSVLPALGYGKIIHVGVGEATQGKKFKVGQFVQGMLGAQTHAIVGLDMIQKRPSIPYMPEHSCLGLLGLITGLTAYSGTFFVTKPPQRNDTVVVSAASGAVGSIVCQLAKNVMGARVIGIAGGQKKNDYLINELQLDACIDYKSSEESVKEQLEKHCANGVDFYFDNVGGEILDHVLDKINPNGRIVICGAVSQYNNTETRGPSNYLKLAERGASMTGFNVMQYLYKIMLAVFWMTSYYYRGLVKMTEHVEKGIDKFPHAMHLMFNGGHIGKLMVDVRD